MNKLFRANALFLSGKYKEALDAYMNILKPRPMQSPPPTSDICTNEESQ